MGDSSKAVFLSYSSEDAEAALRIRDALDAAGVEAWFDKSELRGGEAWDASIRKKIKECALFVPVISANTEARLEGYFRLEWKLAVDRSHLIADGQAFLLPVVVDDTPAATARVPDRFRELQWSRIGRAESPKAFAERVLRLLGRGRTPPPATASRIDKQASDDVPSIAVLPFVNMSRDEENEYFADGLSEELLNVLAKIRGLRVASRTSAFFFKGKNVDIPTIAQKLDVATILEGSVRKSGKRVRITAQLIQVSTDSHLWSATYDRELEDIFAVQDDIAQSVVTELRTALLGARPGPGASVAAKTEVQAAATGRTDNAEAHQLYLKGRFFFERLTSTDVARGADFFHQALALDPEFALAWAGLANAYRLQASAGWLPFAEGFEKAREAAGRALALNPDLAEAHVALAFVLHDHDWNWKAAEAELRRALALAPGNTFVLQACGSVLAAVGRGEEGLDLLRKAAALDPLSPTCQHSLGLRALVFGRLEEAAAALAASLDLSPTSGFNHCYLAQVRLLQGRPAQALEHARREANRAFGLTAIALAEHSMQHPAESERALAALIEEFHQDAAYQVAQVFAWRNEKDRAFEWLERAYVQRDPGIAEYTPDPILANLHDDPRWPSFVKKMGFA